MQETQTLFSHDIYATHLSTINNIHLTSREIDVIACLLSARRTSKTAYFLSINPRTVETHIRNIMAKLECNTREGIIDFIEASDKIHFLRKYYSLLQIEAIFEKHLKDISKLNREKDLRCFFISGKGNDSFISHLKSHLALAGIAVSNSARKKEGDYGIVILPKTLMEEEASLLLQEATRSSNKVLFLLQERKTPKESYKELIDFDVVDFAKHENYYFSFFMCLQKILPNLKIAEVASIFKEQYQKIHIEPDLSVGPSNEKLIKNIFISQKRTAFLFILAAVLIISSGFFVLQWNQTNNNKNTIRSDFVVPREYILLNRPDLIAQIDEKLKKQDGIQTVALLGPGGSGKTTLARQYAHQQKMPIIWEINAETRENLKESFEHLAQALAKSEIDQKLLRGVQKITDSTEKDSRLILFVKERLKSKSNWFLVFDNVEKFTDIQKYYPQDPDTWGKGKILITTRDANIGNNDHVNHVLPIGELNPHQKLTLFTKAITSEDDHPLSEVQIKEANRFLESIPPFPLDITIAAYYLKDTNVSYTAYLNNLFPSNRDFITMQESLLKEVGEYTKTRYEIITLSLKKIIDTHEDFRDLLLLICFLDSQNISRDLLTNFKSETVVDNFIFNLKKYSLLTTEPSTTPSISPLSMHRSTQEITLAYLIKTLSAEKTKELVGVIIESFERYTNEAIKEKDLNKMKIMISSFRSFLNHKYLLGPSTEGIIKGELGIIYYFYCDNMKAKILFEESLSLLNKHLDDNHMRVAMFMGYLGNVFRDLGDYDKGKKYLEKSLSIYDKYYPKNSFIHAHFLVYLGVIERHMGNYDAAKNLFKRGIIIYKAHFPENENYPAWVYGQIGIIDKELGNYDKSKEILEKSLASLKIHRSSNHLDIAWVLEHLGVVYTKLGDYEKAKETLEHSLRIYASYFADQFGPPWILASFEPLDTSAKREKFKNLFDQVVENSKNSFHGNYIYVASPLRQLGNLYVQIGNYGKAKILLEQALIIYEKNYGSNHLQVARTLNDLGRAYFLSGDLKVSENFINRALRIFQQYKHPDAYACLENLSDLYLKKSTLTVSKGNTKEAQNFKAQAVTFLNEALEITKSRFLKGSLHTQRIEEKLNNL